MSKTYIKSLEDLLNAKNKNQKIYIEAYQEDLGGFKKNGFYIKFIDGVPCVFDGDENDKFISYNVDIILDNNYTKLSVEE